MPRASWFELVLGSQLPVEGFRHCALYADKMLLLNEQLGYERLRLRLLRPVDSEAFYNLTNDENIMAMIPELGNPSLRDTTDKIIDANNGTSSRYYGAFEAGKLVGMISVEERAGEIETRYWVGSPFTGRGVAKQMVRFVLEECSRSAPEVSIFAECKPHNTASWTVLIKNGFVDAGRPGNRPGRRRLELPHPERQM